MLLSWAIITQAHNISGNITHTVPEIIIYNYFSILSSIALYSILKITNMLSIVTRLLVTSHNLGEGEQSYFYVNSSKIYKARIFCKKIFLSLNLLLYCMCSLQIIHIFQMIRCILNFMETGKTLYSQLTYKRT